MTYSKRISVSVRAGLAAAAVFFAGSSLAGSYDHSAQRPAPQQAQVTPAQNTISWLADNCQYRFVGNTWQSLDLCRVIVSPGVYDTYRASTRKWLTRIDERERGWIGALSLETPGAIWVKFSTTTGQIFVLLNGRWTDFASLQASAQQPTVQPRAAKPAGGCETIPVYRAMTEQEKRCNDAVVAQIVTGQQIRQLGTFCEQRRAACPYPVVTRQQQEDAKRRGQLADGWYDTATGPRLKGC
jgi:hypothetical protein